MKISLANTELETGVLTFKCYLVRCEELITGNTLDKEPHDNLLMEVGFNGFVKIGWVIGAVSENHDVRTQENNLRYYYLAFLDKKGSGPIRSPPKGKPL